MKPARPPGCRALPCWAGMAGEAGFVERAAWVSLVSVSSDAGRVRWMWRHAIEGSKDLSDGCANFTRKGGFRKPGWTNGGLISSGLRELGDLPRMAGKGHSGEDAE